MRCIKTGCNVFIPGAEPAYAHGDAFLLNSGQLLIRVCWRGMEPQPGNLHFTVHEIEHWFDEYSEHNGAENSTMLVIDNAYENHGYEGRNFSGIVT